MFPLIASHLPLQHLPATLSSLALTCKDIYLRLRYILYCNIIIYNEECASELVETISNDPDLGRLVREFHLRIELSEERFDEEDQGKVLCKLQELIENGAFSQIRYFSLVLLKIPYPRVIGSRLNAQFCLPTGFYASLRRNCPHLRGLCMDGGADYYLEKSQVDGPDAYDLKEFSRLTTLHLKFYERFPLGGSFQDLAQSKLSNPSLFFSNTFPQLKSLSISGFVLAAHQDAGAAMKFWTRHSCLERVVIDSPSGYLWFSKKCTDIVLLPNLTHLGLQLPNPYLLHAVIPDGLPNLKSLEIHQEPYNTTGHRWNYEGISWYETEDGKFVDKNSPTRGRDIDACYMLSILKATPNVEELYINRFPDPRSESNNLNRKHCKKILEVIGRFKLLQRLYHPFTYKQTSSRRARRAQTKLEGVFEPDCRLLGSLCPSLRTVTDVNYCNNGPYFVGHIVRDSGGSVEDVLFSRGFGMELTGEDDDPFPLNKHQQTYDR